MAFFRQHPIREDALSAYVDAALSGAEQTRVEGHLETCERCRAAVAELRAVRGALQELPRERAPRSFALRRADIERPRAAAPSGLLRASPMLGAVATIALLAFFSLVGLDVAGGPSSGGERAAGSAAVPLSQGPALEHAADGGGEPATRSTNRFAPETDGVERGSDDGGFSLPNDTAAAAEATRAAILALTGPEATAPAPLPATGPEVDAATARNDDDRTGLRAAEAATAAVAVVAGGTFAFAWWRRRV